MSYRKFRSFPSTFLSWTQGWAKYSLPAGLIQPTEGFCPSCCRCLGPTWPRDSRQPGPWHAQPFLLPQANSKAGREQQPGSISGQPWQQQLFLAAAARTSPAAQAPRPIHPMPITRNTICTGRVCNRGLGWGCGPVGSGIKE